jgi:hypothetical protein
MIRFLLFFSLSALLFACSSGIPKDVIKPTEFKAVIWDMLKADNLAQEVAARDTSKKLPSQEQKYIAAVLAIHKITKQQFETSLQYYERDPKALGDMLGTVQKLKKKTNKVDISKRKFLKDSTKVYE